MAISFYLRPAASPAKTNEKMRFGNKQNALTKSKRTFVYGCRDVNRAEKNQ